MLKFLLRLVFLSLIARPYYSCAQQDTTGSVNTEKQSAQALADKLSNPVASMISVPFQNNTDWGIGDYNGSKNTLNFQPVIPITLSKNLNLITRLVLPFITQQDVLGPGTHETGLADATISGFFSSSHPKNGFIWGFGPALLIPTATSEYLGTKKFGVGPTALVLKQGKGNTVGFLANQLWSVAGDKDRQDVNQLFVQPFFSHSFKSGAALGGNMELTQNWEGHTITLFLNPVISGITKIGKQPVQLAVGPRIPLAGPDAVRPAFGIRSVLIFVFAQ
ncbi:hypothetical protein GS399_19875 [Pedobacter sp. HMF7647]|uniref:Transporter n=1 Tax=Hufsiella arboris TaxID=2695275 RepID=A0A7K1YFN4_9SPHI|nr:hypothetical protein [Hufsiella arboris]MXV53231.1 hypothetical protein [Hufsiella arboris]